MSADSSSHDRPPGIGSQLIIFGGGYRIPVYNTSALRSGHGGFYELGFNPGYFISHQLLLGIYADVDLRDIFWGTHFSDPFKDEFIASYHNDYSGNDSIVLEHFYNDARQSGSFHEGGFKTGIIFRPIHSPGLVFKAYYFFRYIEAKRGNSGPGDPTCTNSADHEYLDLNYKNYSFGTEILFFPGFRTPPIRDEDNDRLITLQRFYLGMFAEYSINKEPDFTYDNGCYQTTLPLSSFTNATFAGKYPNDLKIGFRLGIGIY